MKPREVRLKVNITARLRTGVEWADLRIENLSSRGLLIKTKTELKVGSYVEVRHGTLIIIGRIVWTRGAYSGVRSQDRIDTAEVFRETKTKHAASASPVTSRPADRRKDELRVSEQAVRERAERSRSLANASQFVILGTSAAAGCILIAVTVAHFLRGVSGTITAALGG